MAIVINKTVSDAASTACFEISNDDGGESVSIDASSLSGAHEDLKQSIMVTRVFGTVVPTGAGAGYVTLAWGNGQEFLYLPQGVHDIDMCYETADYADGDGDIVVTAEADTRFSLKIFVKKVIGFPLSMAHARNRP